MLRCSNIQARRQDDHKDVAFFASKGLFWSPKYGEINTKKSSISSMIYKPPDLRGVKCGFKMGDFRSSISKDEIEPAVFFNLLKKCSSILNMKRNSLLIS